ncbi:hypothetical protein DICVIV_13172 [Dictyocaulus viviparus]|uniref:Uncharacterized protein n=1 Tax=Dictyocaulus viviparus TaxID=29172 RepID=A0A0D8XAS1_DICVI|nr:hypothetical protein DICVIV_13172 [Dictyocaulus viviparus]
MQTKEELGKRLNFGTVDKQWERCNKEPCFYRNARLDQYLYCLYNNVIVLDYKGDFETKNNGHIDNRAKNGHKSIEY